MSIPILLLPSFVPVVDVDVVRFFCFFTTSQDTRSAILAKKCRSAVMTGSAVSGTI